VFSLTHLGLNAVFVKRESKPANVKSRLANSMITPALLMARVANFRMVNGFVPSSIGKLLSRNIMAKWSKPSQSRLFVTQLLSFLFIPNISGNLTSFFKAISRDDLPFKCLNGSSQSVKGLVLLLIIQAFSHLSAEWKL